MLFHFEQTGGIGTPCMPTNQKSTISTIRIVTPHLDALASEGVVLKNYYVQPICSPTRSALMTGRYPLRLGTQANVIYWDTPWGVPLENKFLGEHMIELGFSTAMFGKWHLGMFKRPYLPVLVAAVSSFDKSNSQQLFFAV